MISPPPPEPEYLTPPEVAKLLRVSVKSIYRWLREDPGMPALRLGGTVRFPRSPLLRWLEYRTSGPAKARQRFPKQERGPTNLLSVKDVGRGGSAFGPFSGPTEPRVGVRSSE